MSLLLAFAVVGRAVCHGDGIANQSRLGLCDLKEGEVLEVRVLYTLALNGQLLSYRRQLLASIQLLDGTLQTFQAQDERRDIVE